MRGHLTLLEGTLLLQLVVSEMLTRDQIQILKIVEFSLSLRIFLHERVVVRRGRQSPEVKRRFRLFRSIIFSQKTLVAQRSFLPLIFIVQVLDPRLVGGDYHSELPLFLRNLKFLSCVMGCRN